MKNRITTIILSIFVLVLIIGCKSDVTSEIKTELIKLGEYETIISYENNILGSPTILKFNDSHLYLYDSQVNKVLKTDTRGKNVSVYGREGRGPGEFLEVSDIFFANDNIYILDTNQFLIHKYEQDGSFVSSITFTLPENELPPPPPLPPIPQDLYNFLTFAFMYNLDNQPHITLDGDILLPTAYDSGATSLYELKDKKGNIDATIGDMPEGSSFGVDFQNYKNSISNREIPSVYSQNTFLVKDKANPEEYFLVYSANSKIAKYHLSGKKLWEKGVPDNPETESTETVFYETADHVLDFVDMVVPLRKYWGGVSSQDGELYLATYGYVDYEKKLIIHHFSNTGNLLYRYELSANEELLPVFDLDHSADKIFIATEEAEIREYTF